MTERKKVVVAVVIRGPLNRSTDREHLVRISEFVRSLRREEIILIPISPRDFYRRLRSRYIEGTDWPWEIDEWRYWLELGPFWDTEQLPEIELRRLSRQIKHLFHTQLISGVIITSYSLEVSYPDIDWLKILVKEIDAPILHVTVSEKLSPETIPTIADLIPGIRSFRDPEQRPELIKMLKSLPAVRDPQEWFGRDTMMLERRTPVPLESAAPAPPTTDGSPRDRTYSPTQEVHLGTAAPRSVYPSQEFVARFAAYTLETRSEVERIITQETSPSSLRLDSERCNWRLGTKVTVRLQAQDVEIQNPIQTFKWNGSWHILRFDAKVSVTAKVETIILKFDVAVEGVPIVAIRPEITVSTIIGRSTASNPVFTGQKSPTTAFASYSSKDKRDVLGRVRSLQIFTDIDVFLDCLSIRPGEQWKPTIKDEIAKREIFWLFWSRNALASEWVQWEWQTALDVKSISAIQPHPLEPCEVAPAPKRLESLQFGAMYEWYLLSLRESRTKRLIRFLRSKLHFPWQRSKAAAA